MEVLFHSENYCLAIWNFFRLVTPLSRNLDGCLHSFRTSVHGKHHFITKHSCDRLGKSREHIVVEGSAAQRQSLCLIRQGLDELGMTMALIDRAIRR